VTTNRVDHNEGLKQSISSKYKTVLNDHSQLQEQYDNNVFNTKQMMQQLKNKDLTIKQLQYENNKIFQQIKRPPIFKI
jgi:fructose/tagatose bisphosphate aldolase